MQNTTDEASDGNGEESRLAAPSISELTADERTSDGAGLHGRDEVALEICLCLVSLDVQTEFSMVSSQCLVTLENVTSASVFGLPFEVGHHENATNDTRINAKEGTGETCLRRTSAPFCSKT